MYIIFFDVHVLHIPYSKIYTCHAFYPTVPIPEGELFGTDKFMTTMKKKYYWYHDSYESIPVMVKLKQVVMPYIEVMQDKNTKNKFPSYFKVYADMKPRLWSEHNHQIILDKIEARENLNHDEYVEYENY